MHVPRPRPARPGQSWRRCASSWRPSACRSRAARCCGRATSTASSSARARTAGGRSWSTRWCCAARRRPPTVRANIGHFGLALRALRPFHLADPPLRRPAGASRADLRPPPRRRPARPSTEERFRGSGRPHLGDRAAGGPAERDAVDRFTAAYLSARVGDIFTGRITGVTRFGLFVTLFETGADGLVPIGTLGRTIYEHDEKRHALVGRRSGETFRLGERVAVRLIEAEPATGGVLLELVHGEDRPQGEPRPAWAAWRGRRRDILGPIQDRRTGPLPNEVRRPSRRRRRCASAGRRSHESARSCPHRAARAEAAPKADAAAAASLQPSYGARPRTSRPGAGEP